MMSYDSWKTTDPRDSEPDYDVREELDDFDRADMDEGELDYLEERQSERDERERAEDRADLIQAAFWKSVNDLSIEYPQFTVVVIPEVTL